MKNNGNQLYGNCDEFLYLGGNEQSTHKFLAELLGKETIDTNTYGKSTGHSGNYSTNYQNTGRELLTADEVRMLENEKAILLIRGEKPVIDFKYDIMKHPNVKYTADGNRKMVYEYGIVEKASATISFVPFNEITKDTKFIEIEETEDKEKQEVKYELLSEEEIENYYLMEEYENERKQEQNK